MYQAYEKINLMLMQKKSFVTSMSVIKPNRKKIQQK